MEIPGAVIAFTIILGVAYWINSSHEEKTAAGAAENAAKFARDELKQAREDARAAIQKRAEKFDIHFSDDELNWICYEVEAEAGRDGLLQVAERYSRAGDEGDRTAIREQFELIKLSYQEHLQESESERKWQVILEDFKRLNHDQQKSHLAYLKKHHTGELTDEQLHILELVSLGEVNTPKSKDIEVGGVKLFTMKEK